MADVLKKAQHSRILADAVIPRAIDAYQEARAHGIKTPRSFASGDGARIPHHQQKIVYPQTVPHAPNCPQSRRDQIIHHCPLHGNRNVMECGPCLFPPVYNPSDPR